MSQQIIPFAIFATQPVKIGAGSLPWERSHYQLVVIDPGQGQLAATVYAWFGREFASIQEAAAARDQATFDVAASLHQPSPPLDFDAGGVGMISLFTEGGGGVAVRGYFMFTECDCAEKRRALCALEKIAAKL